MSTSKEYIQFLIDQIDKKFSIRSRPMFGEYMVYVNEKPILLVCDNTVYVKKIDSLTGLIPEKDQGVPYPGAKEHFILDIENRELLNNAIQILEKEIQVPKKKGKKG